MKIAAVALLCALNAAPSWAAGLVFGIAGKSADVNFIAAAKGCNDEARRQGDRCERIGRSSEAHARKQNRAILEALLRPSSDLAGLAVSITDPDYLAGSSLAEAARLKVPVVTFDSDLGGSQVYLRRAYVGPDNLEIGRQLGDVARQAHPQGGVACLMSGHERDPNLNLRLWGVRQALSGNRGLPDGQKLSGENGWREPDRCPWYNHDDYKRAVKQMRMALKELGVDSFISVGAWPQTDLGLYRATFDPIRRQDTTWDQTVIVGIGEASPQQLQLLQEGLAHGYVSINFSEMGRAAYRAMKRLASGQPVPELISTPTTLYRR